MPRVQSVGAEESPGWKGAWGAARLWMLMTLEVGWREMVRAARAVSVGTRVLPVGVAAVKSWAQGVSAVVPPSELTQRAMELAGERMSASRLVVEAGIGGSGGGCGGEVGSVDEGVGKRVGVRGSAAHFGWLRR